jgi:hypothetical protein
MKIKALTELLRKPKDLGSGNIPDLTKLTTQYPFFQIPHIMLAKSLHNTESVRKDDKIFEAALYAPDRSKLHDYIIDSLVVDSIVSDNITEQKAETIVPAESEVIKKEESKETVDLNNEVKEEVKAEEPVIEIEDSSKEVRADVVTEVKLETVEAETEKEEVVVEKVEVKEEVNVVEDVKEQKPVVEELKETEIEEAVEAEIEESVAESIDNEIKKEEELKSVDIPEVTVPEKPVDDNKDELLNVMEVISSPDEEEIELLDWSTEDDEKISLTNKKEAPKEEEDSEVIEGLYYPSADYLATLSVTEDEKGDKETVEKENSAKTVNDSKLIEDFLKSEPRIVPKPDFDDGKEDLAESSIKEDSEIVTESLAKIYMQQKLYGKAINIYEKLSLKYPKKSAYFASQIDKINKLM